MTEASKAGSSFSPQPRDSGFIGPSSLAMGLGPIAVLSLALLVTLTGDTARAATIRDGQDFSVSIDSPGTRICIFFPQSARDPAACGGLTLPTQAPSDAKLRHVAIGLIRFVDAGTAARASLSVTFVPAPRSTEPDQTIAEEFARGLQAGVTRDYPGASIRSGTSHAQIRVIAGLKVVRASYDVDGLKNDDRLLMEHQIAYLAWAEDGLYAVMLMTGGEHTAAVDALADRSALTLRVSHPAQPALLMRAAVAVCLWLVFAVGTASELLWAFLRHGARVTTPPGLGDLTTRSPFLNATEFDVSTPSLLRKRLRPASPSLKIIGLLSAFWVTGYLDHYSGFVASLVCAFVGLWCASRVSTRLRSGSVLCAGLACAWCVLWAGFEVFDQLPKAVRAGLELYSVLWLSLSIIPIGFLARGLLAFRALRAYQKSARNAGDPLANHPWEEGLYTRRHPKFVNRRSIEGRVFLLLAPVPYLWVWATAETIDKREFWNAVQRGLSFQEGCVIGQYTGAFVLALGALAWGARIYRRARREAMLPGSELVKRDARPIVLYLRSFHDDSGIKLRARATDGRILLERLLKISFEELITDHLWGHGPALAIGSPRTKGEPAPLGAARDYVADASWRETAANLMRQASMIVAVAGATRGLAWEIDTIVEQGLVSKLVLLLPPLEIDRLKARWQFLLSGAIRTSLPGEVDLLRARAVVFPGGHSTLITGNERNDWTYEAVLDGAALVIANQGPPVTTGGRSAAEPPGGIE